MKKILLTLAALALASSLQAQEYESMLGFELAQTRGYVSNTNYRWSNSFGARVGAETGLSRVYVNYNYIDADSSVSTGTYAIQTLELNIEAKTRPYFDRLRGFAGGHVGAVYSRIKVPIRNFDQDDFDLIYGVQGGMIVEFTDNLYLEIGYKYSWTQSKEYDVNFERLESVYGAFNFKI
ncbi:outer membrane beta-barrel protein [Sulfurimonas sp. MAG313]|nr:outer membrane beta-barrel protein [Sulfurimonas sp. MAG313]MDF1881634.1 outer membrane beta-barrel protein [Sulfurimonas sp. MAG313]